MGKTIEEQLAEILGAYADQVEDVIEVATKKTAQSVKQELQRTSPKQTGKYARSWAIKKTDKGYIVYNKEGWKTYLLENGHVIKNRRKGPQLGRVNGQKHIAPAQQKGAKLFIDNLKKMIENI